MFEFEVRETDLLGRIGTIRVGAKSLETPCLLPVIHPVNQAVPLSTIAALGFRGVMTNSYIISERRRQEALDKGVHSLLGFDGTVMTDSGGYQVLEYGSMGLDYRQVASFQADIGSDFAVTLDRPTGYPQTRKKAKETMGYSLKNALATRKEFASSGTNWIGPVQGGLHADLLRRSASAMVSGGFEFLALGSPTQVMENYMFSDLVRMIVATRKVVPYSVPLHLFGAGHPLTMALAVALGCDTFDSASYILFARNGRYMTRRGVANLSSMKFLPCSCQICAGNTVKGLQELDHGERTRLLAVHNLFILNEEMETCKQAIAEGRLWDLVEERSMAHPRLREAFFELGRDSKLLAEGTPVLKDKGLFIRSGEDLSRPEVLTAERRTAWSFKRRSENALLVPGEMSTPEMGKGANGPDVYRSDPVFGPYPAELDSVYPFGQVTVAGMPSDRKLAAESVAMLRRMGYRRVVVLGGRRTTRSRRSRRGASPSPPSSSVRPRSLRRP